MRNLSNKYRAIDTAELTGKINDHLRSRGIDSRTTKKSLTHGKELIQFDLLDYQNSGFGGIIPNIKFFNSHDGQSKARFQVGFSRLICSNGCTVGTDLFSQAITHIKGDATEEAIRNIPHYVAATLEYIQDELMPLLESLQNTPVTRSQMLQIVDSLKIPKTVKEKSLQAVLDNRVRPTYDQDNNLFSLYNFVNEFTRTAPKSTLASQERVEKTLMADIVAASKVVA